MIQTSASAECDDACIHENTARITYYVYHHINRVLSGITLKRISIEKIKTSGVLQRGIHYADKCFSSERMHFHKDLPRQFSVFVLHFRVYVNILIQVGLYGLDLKVFTKHRFSPGVKI